MYMIEITEQKLNKATDYAEKMLKYGGMLMQCLTEWEEENGMGERSGESGRYSRSMMGQRDDYRNYGNRGGYGNRMNYRDEEDEWDDDEMGERRGVRGSGRSRRY